MSARIFGRGSVGGEAALRASLGATPIGWRTARGEIIEAGCRQAVDPSPSAISWGNGECGSRVIFWENFGEDTVVKVGEALEDETFVAEWVSVDLGSEYTPPIAARKLTSRQRLQARWKLAPELHELLSPD